MAYGVLLLLAIFVLTLLFIWNQYNLSYWQRKGVPYKRPLPIIGNIKVFLCMSKSLYLYFSDNVYNDAKFAQAPVVGVYIFSKPMLVLREPELIKSVLIKDFHKFSNRHIGADAELDPLSFHNIFFVKNPQWKEIRTKLTPVFTSGKLKQMYPLMLEIGLELEHYLDVHPKTANNTIESDLKEICGAFTTDMIATVAFGLRANSLRNPHAEFRQYTRPIFDFSLTRAKNNFIAFLLPKLVSFFRIRLLDQRFTKYMRQTVAFVMSERMRTGQIRNDLIDILLKIKQEAAQQAAAEQLEDHPDFLVAQAALFIIAGFETSATTMSFTLYEMSKHAEMQQRLRAEIHAAFVEENGTITYERLTSMDYLDMVVSEVLRLYPPLPFLDREHVLPENESNFSLKPYLDYELPVGLGIFIPTFGIHRNAKYWPDPLRFDPERFSIENRKLIAPMSYLPFGNGPHNCIGARYALLQVKLGLVHIFKNHYVQPCKKTVSEVIFEPKSFMLQSQGGIYLSLINDRKYDNAVTSERLTE